MKTAINLKKIKGKRAERGMTQSDLANILNLSTVQYGKKEQGKNKFTADEVFLIAKVTGVEVGYFFN